MKIYKYKSLSNLWHVLDVLVHNRLYCAHWSELNDPLEGRYEIYLGSKNEKVRNLMVGRIEGARDGYRIASLSADPNNFLLWSHYADGHKGVAVEVDIPEDHPALCKVTYSPFSSVFTEKLQTKEDMRHLFNGKGEEWEYEREYRIICEQQFFNLDTSICRVLVGPMVSEERVAVLRAATPKHIELVRMGLDRVQGTLRVISPNNAIHATCEDARA